LQAVEREVQSLVAPLTSEQSLGPGTYGPGIYADGRVIVEPTGDVRIGTGGSLNVAPGSEVVVGPESTIIIKPDAFVTVGAGGKIILHPNSTIYVSDTAYIHVFPDSVLQLNQGLIGDGLRSRVSAFAPLTIAGSIVDVGHDCHYISVTRVDIRLGVVIGTPEITGPAPRIYSL
jgi:hypothetical protein